MCADGQHIESVGPVPLATRHFPLHLVENNGGDDHQPLDDHLPELADAHHDETVAEYADDEGADDGAADGAASAGERGAAEDCCRDGVHLERGAAGGVRCHQLRRNDQAGNGCAGAGDDVDDDLDAVDVHAREQRGPLVAADGVDLPTERCAPGDVGGGERYDDHQDHRNRDAEHGAGAEDREAGVAELLLADEIGEGFAVGEQQGGAARDVHRSQRGNERRDREPRNQQAVDQSDENPGEQGKNDDFEDARIRRRVHERDRDASRNEQTGNHADEADDRADRQVDAAGDDDVGHADGEEGVDRHVLGNDDQIAERDEVGRHDAEIRGDDDQRDQRAQLEQQHDGAGALFLGFGAAVKDGACGVSHCLMLRNRGE